MLKQCLDLHKSAYCSRLVCMLQVFQVSSWIQNSVQIPQEYLYYLHVQEVLTDCLFLKRACRLEFQLDQTESLP